MPPLARPIMDQAAGEVEAQVDGAVAEEGTAEESLVEEHHHGAVLEDGADHLEVVDGEERHQEDLLVGLDISNFHCKVLTSLGGGWGAAPPGAPVPGPAPTSGVGSGPQLPSCFMQTWKDSGISSMSDFKRKSSENFAGCGSMMLMTFQNSVHPLQSQAFW
jgi:hypothetical protein